MPTKPLRLHGQVSTPPSLAPAPCLPSSVCRLCRVCFRKNNGLPDEAEDRPGTIVIDASVLHGDDGQCPMFMPRRIAIARLPYREVR